MGAARNIQTSPKIKSTQFNKKKTVDVLLQNLGGKWFAFWELNGEIYYQACPVPVSR